MNLKFNNIFKNEIKRGKNHIYILPCKSLRQYIAHYTISFINTYSISNYLTIIPDASGCFVFTYDGNNFISELFGPSTQAVILKNDLNTSPMKFFIEFFPLGLFLFTGISQKDLTDLIMPLSFADKQLHTSVLEAFERADNLDEFILIIDNIICNFIKAKEIPDVLLSSIRYLKKYNGTISIKELSTHEYYSQRHINRLFNDYIGINAKTFSKIIRINSSIQLLKNDNATFTSLAYNTGFYDQSHFIHDFKTICGTTPRNYISMMSSFYNEPLKL